MRLYPYQWDGVEFLWRRRRAYLADGMGLGKTVQAAVAARRLAGRFRTLVIAPASAIENWHREWAEWGPKGFFAAISYSSLLGREDVRSGNWDLVILDEAHYTKNPRAKRTLAALNVARAARRASWLLSGTPMPNDPGELWAPIRALWPAIPLELGLTSYTAWFNHFCYWHLTRFGRRAHGVKNGPQLREILSRIMLRRTLDDVALDLPPLRVDVHLLPRDASFERALEQAGYDAGLLGEAMEAEDTEEGSAARLRHLLGEYKAPRIGEIIAGELADGEYPKVVVLAYHRAVLERLREKLQGFGVVGFDGSTPQVKRQAAIDEFQSGASRVFLAQQSAAGIAINLQAASELVLVEPDWSPDQNAQAIKRIHRIGQSSPCRARVFGVAGSMDEAVMRTVAAKTRMQSDLGLGES